MATGEHTKAVKAAQLLLSIYNPAIVVDGIWGKKSSAALNVTRGEAGDLVRSVKSFSDTLNVVKQPVSGGNWISRSEAIRVIDDVSVVSGVPQDWLLFMLDKEPNKRQVRGSIEYQLDSVAPNNLYFGLMQVGADAWTDASALYPELGSFARNKFVPELNVLAAAGFAKRNMSYARNIHRYNGDFDAEIIYAMHNQGHSFISSAKAGGMGKYSAGQSAEAKLVLAEAAVRVRSYST